MVNLYAQAFIDGRHALVAAAVTNYVKVFRDFPAFCVTVIDGLVIRRKKT